MEHSIRKKSQHVGLQILRCSLISVVLLFLVHLSLTTLSVFISAFRSLYVCVSECHSWLFGSPFQEILLHMPTNCLEHFRCLLYLSCTHSSPLSLSSPSQLTVGRALSRYLPRNGNIPHNGKKLWPNAISPCSHFTGQTTLKDSRPPTNSITAQSL